MDVLLLALHTWIMVRFITDGCCSYPLRCSSLRSFLHQSDNNKKWREVPRSAETSDIAKPL